MQYVDEGCNSVNSAFNCEAEDSSKKVKRIKDKIFENEIIWRIRVLYTLARR